MKAKSLLAVLTATVTILSMYGSVSMKQYPYQNTVFAESADPTEGDLNKDHKLTMVDAVILSRFIAEDDLLPEKVASAVTLETADLDKDQLLTALDVIKLLTKISENTQQVLSDEDTPLTILTEFLLDPESEYYKMLAVFEANHPEYTGMVRFDSLGISAMGEEELREAYANYFAGGGNADLYILNQDRGAKYINSDQYSLPLTELGLQESDFDQCFPYTLQIGRDQNGTLKAVSMGAAPGAYVYRADLAKSLLGASTPEEMQTFVRDWSEFTETAEKVRQLTNGKTAMADTFQGLWNVWSCNIRATYKDSEGIAQISDDGKIFADLAKLYYDNGYVTKEDPWTDGWYEIGQDDRTMGYFFSSWCFGENSMLNAAEGRKNGATYGKYRTTEGPAKWYWGGDWIAASPKCRNRKLAHDFLCEITNSDSMLQYQKLIETVYLVNNADAVTKFIETSGYENPLLGGQSQYPALLNNAAADDFSTGLTEYDSDLEWLFYEHAVDYIKGKISTFDDLQSVFQRSARKIH